MTYEDLRREWEGEGTTIEAHTSGSTGRPKSIRLSKDFVEASARRTNTFFGLDSGSRFHSCVSPEFIGGKMMGIRAWIAGARLTWEKPSNRILLDVEPDETINLLAVVPSQMLSILNGDSPLPRIRNIIIGGSPIDRLLKERIADSGLRAFETYGMTETASHIALRPINSSDCGFRPLEGIRVTPDVRGCAIIEFDSGERVTTNDLVKMEADGSFHIIGRMDDVILSGGRKVNPAEIEQKLAAHITNPFVIDSEPDMKWGEMVVLRIEGQCSRSDSELMEIMKGVLESWERPKMIRHEERLQRTPSGKIRRSGVRRKLN